MDDPATATRRHPTPRPLGRATGAMLPDATTLGVVRLRVRERARALEFYERAIGLVELTERGSDDLVVLADQHGVPVVELEVRPDARPPGRTAGLYHVALLYPRRAELARAIRRIAELGLPVEGASDHGTHEALYLADPDGNGIELAADRPSRSWPSLADIESIRPRPLDLRDLLESASGDDGLPARAAPGLRVGHVHLHVGEIESALVHYVDALGFELVTSIDSAAFVSAGGYHHHLAVNTWRGAGVAAPVPDALGLVYWTIQLPAPSDLDDLASRLDAADRAYERIAHHELRMPDPWGIELRVVVEGAVGTS